MIRSLSPLSLFLALPVSLLTVLLGLRFLASAAVSSVPIFEYFHIVNDWPNGGCSERRYGTAVDVGYGEVTEGDDVHANENSQRGTEIGPSDQPIPESDLVREEDVYHVLVDLLGTVCRMNNDFSNRWDVEPLGQRIRNGGGSRPGIPQGLGICERLLGRHFQHRLRNRHLTWTAHLSQSLAIGIDCQCPLRRLLSHRPI